MSKDPYADAPHLPAFMHPNEVHALVYCQHCRFFHQHGQANLGHRICHCADPSSPYDRTGYVLFDAGPATPALLSAQKRLKAEAQRRSDLALGIGGPSKRP